MQIPSFISSEVFFTALVTFPFSMSTCSVSPRFAGICAGILLVHTGSGDDAEKPTRKWFCQCKTWDTKCGHLKHREDFLILCERSEAALKDLKGT